MKKMRAFLLSLTMVATMFASHAVAEEATAILSIATPAEAVEIAVAEQIEAPVEKMIELETEIVEMEVAPVEEQAEVIEPEAAPVEVEAEAVEMEEETAELTKLPKLDVSAEEFSALKEKLALEGITQVIASAEKAEMESMIEPVEFPLPVEPQIPAVPEIPEIEYIPYREVEIYCEAKEIFIGDEVLLRSRLTGFEGADLTFCWQWLVSVDGESVWQDAPGGSRETYTFIMTEDMVERQWRLLVLVND